MALVREYAESKADSVFAELVSRHVDLVYSSALRQVRDPHMAEEVTQVVFIILAKKAASLNEKTILGGWLYRTTRYVAANVLQAEIRRQKCEMEAHLESTLHEQPTESVWREMLPLLDDALAQLRQTDRDAVVLRYFENRSLQEVAAALGLKERAAQKRVLRSVEKLRHFFLKRGVTISATAIAGAVSANSVQAAPAALRVSIAGAIKSQGTMPLAVAGAEKMMASAKVKVALMNAGFILLMGGVAGVTVARTPLFHWLGIGGAREQTSAWALRGESAPFQKGAPNEYSGHGELFTIYNPGKLFQIEAPIQSVNAGSLKFFIATDNNGRPGEVLETFPAVLAPRIGDTNRLILQSVARPQLLSGAKYWFCAEPSDTNAMALWFYNVAMPPKEYAAETAQESWDVIEWNTNRARFWNYPNHIDPSKANSLFLAVTR